MFVTIVALSLAQLTFYPFSSKQNMPLLNTMKGPFLEQR